MSNGTEGTIATLRNPEYRARILHSFGRQGLMAHLGASIERLAPGHCVVALPFRPEIAQQHGYFHGGAIGAIADNAGAYAAFTLIGAEESMLTVEYKVNLLTPAQGTILRAVGDVLRAGRTLSVSDVRVFAGDTERTPCATATVTVAILRTRGDGT